MIDNSTRALTLYLNPIKASPHWKLDELIVKSGKHSRLDKGGKFDKRAKLGIDSLCLLLIQTYISRINDPGGPANIPENLYPGLQTLWGSKSEKGTLWQHELFDFNPFYSEEKDEHQPDKETSPYLFRSGSKDDSYKVWLNPGVQIKVLSRTTDKEIAPLNLYQFSRKLAKIPSSEAKRVTIEIIPIEGGIISSATREGSVTQGSKIQIQVERNFETHLCVFWIDSQNQVSSFFPFPDFKLKSGAFAERINDSVTQLLIPAIRRLDIDSPAGIETCLVLTRDEKFTRPVVSKIRKHLVKMASIRNGEMAIDNPIFTPLTVPQEEPAVLTRRIKLESQPEGWDEQLASGLSQLAKKAYLFEIPNR